MDIGRLLIDWKPGIVLETFIYYAYYQIKGITVTIEAFWTFGSFLFDHYADIICAFKLLFCYKLISGGPKI